jgi:hypothetical protein
MSDWGDVWPFPFKGIEYAVQFSSVEELQTIVAKLIMCDHGKHQHNFAVQVDGTTLHVSKLGTKCLKDILSTTLIGTRVSYVRDDIRGSEEVSEVSDARRGPEADASSEGCNPGS